MPQFLTASNGNVTSSSVNGIVINSLVLFKMKTREETSPLRLCIFGAHGTARRVKVRRVDQTCDRRRVLSGGNSDPCP